MPLWNCRKQTQQSRTKEAWINLSSRNFRTGQSEAPGLWAWFSPPPAPPALPRYRQHVSNRRPHKAPYFPQSLTQRLEWRKSRNPVWESANLQLALPTQLFGTQTVCWNMVAPRYAPVCACADDLSDIAFAALKADSSPDHSTRTWSPRD